MRDKPYEILKSLLAYGPMHVSISHKEEPFYSEGFVVRFYKADNTEWVANFQSGWTELSGVFELKDSSNLLVIAYGSCYIMSPESETPVSLFGIDYKEMYQLADGHIVLQNDIGFTIVETDGTYWDTKRISWDGFMDVQVYENKIAGLAFTPLDAKEWVTFEYDIDTKVLIGGSYKD